MLQSTIKLCLTLIFTLSLTSLIGQNKRVLYSKAKINLYQKDIKKLAALGVEVDHGTLVKNRFIINDYSVAEIAKMREAGFEVEVLIEDVSAWYVTQNKNYTRPIESRDADCNEGGSSPVFTTPANYSYGSMGGYLTYSEALIELDKMHTLYPNLISQKAPIGSILTHENRPIHWLRISNNPNTEEDEPEILYTALHHAREPNSLSNLVFFMWYLLENYATNDEIKYLVDNAQIYFIPIVNPDGYVYNEQTDPNGGGNQRKNRNPDGNVDLNRNYGYHWGDDDIGSSPDLGSQTYRGTAPFSEPETQAVRDFCNDHNFRITLNYHTYGNLLIHPWGYSDMPTDEHATFQSFGNIMTKYNNFLFGTGTETVGYTVNGDSDDWMYGETSTKPAIYSMTPEVGPGNFGFWPPEGAIDDLNKTTIYQNMMAIHLILNLYDIKTSTSQTVMSYSTDTINLKVTKPGLKSGDVTLNISIPNPHFTPSFTSQNLSLAHLEEWTNSLYVTAGSEALPGESFDVIFILDNGLNTLIDTLDRTYLQGNTNILFSDNFDDTQNWNTNEWGLTTATYYSAPSSYTDSPFGNYNDATENFSDMVNTYAIPESAVQASLNFYAKWEIEADYDYAQVFATTDDINYTALCGQYTKLGNIYQDEDQPLYDGTQTEWVHEQMDLTDYIGQEVKILFKLTSDGFVNKEGIFIDDINLDILTPEADNLTILINNDKIRIAPNPFDEELRIRPITYNLQSGHNYKIKIYDILGHEIYTQKNIDNTLIPTTSWSPGIYIIQLYDDNQAIEQYKIVK